MQRLPTIILSSEFLWAFPSLHCLCESGVAHPSIGDFNINTLVSPKSIPPQLQLITSKFSLWPSPPQSPVFQASALIANVYLKISTSLLHLPSTSWRERSDHCCTHMTLHPLQRKIWLYSKANFGWANTSMQRIPPSFFLTTSGCSGMICALCQSASHLIRLPHPTKNVHTSSPSLFKGSHSYTNNLCSSTPVPGPNATKIEID